MINNDSLERTKYTVETKQCRICGSVKPLTEFYTHPGTRDGHQTMCKSCMRAYARVQKQQWRERQREMRNEIADTQMKRIVGKRERAPMAKCNNCPARYICEIRVRKGLWALCELPDLADYKRAERIGIQI